MNKFTAENKFTTETYVMVAGYIMRFPVFRALVLLERAMHLDTLLGYYK